MKALCPHCERKLNIPDKYIGREAKCPKCSKRFTVTSEGLKAKFLEPENKTEHIDKAASKRPSLGPNEEKSKPKTVWSFVEDFFLFRIMIFPWVIIITFALCVFAVVVWYLVDLLPQSEAEPSSFQPLSTSPVYSILEHKWLIILFGLFWLRVVCEWLILFFRIYTRLGTVETILQKANSGADGTQEKPKK